MNEPLRDPDSQALIFPANEAADLAAQSVEHVRKMYLDVLTLRDQLVLLVDFMMDTPHHQTLPEIKKALLRIGNQ